MVDSLILHRHADAYAEMGEGLYFALDIIGGTSWKALTVKAGF